MKYRETDQLQLLVAANPVPINLVDGWGQGKQGRQLLADVMGSSTVSNTGRSTRGYRTRWVMPAFVVVLLVGVATTRLPQLWTGSPREQVLDGRREAPITLESLSRVAANQSGIAANGPVRYTKTRTVTSQFTVGSSPYTILIGRTREIWVLPDGSGRSRSGPVSTNFPSDEDRKAWEASGSPSLENGRIEERTFGPGELHFEDYTTLPLDTDQLFQAIKQRAGSSGPGPDSEMFIVVGDLLRGMYAPPQLRASLFRVAALIPNVEITEGAVDPEGRRGVGTSLSYDDQNGSIMKVERIFDPETTQLLAETQTVLAKTRFQIDSPPPGAPRSTRPALGPPTQKTPEATVVESTVYLVDKSVPSLDYEPG